MCRCLRPQAPAGISTINFQGRVPNELEAIFRRGSEWEAGVELVVALALQASRRLCLRRQGWDWEPAQQHSRVHVFC